MCEDICLFLSAFVFRVPGSGTAGSLCTLSTVGTPTHSCTPSPSKGVTWADEIMYVKALVNCKAQSNANDDCCYYSYHTPGKPCCLPPSQTYSAGQPAKLKLDSPSHVGGGPGANPSRLLAAGGRYRLPQTLPAYKPPHLPSVMAFPVLPGFGGLTPEGNLSSSESSRATEVIDSLGLSSHPLPPAPSPPSARSGARLPRKDLTGNFLQLSDWGSSVYQLPASLPTSSLAVSPPQSPSLLDIPTSTLI